MPYYTVKTDTVVGRTYNIKAATKEEAEDIALQVMEKESWEDVESGINPEKDCDTTVRVTEDGNPNEYYQSKNNLEREIS